MTNHFAFNAAASLFFALWTLWFISGAWHAEEDRRNSAIFGVLLASVFSSVFLYRALS